MKKVLHISIYPEKWKLYSKKWWVASYTKNLITSFTDNETVMSIFCDIDSEPETYLEDGVNIIRGRTFWIKSFFKIVSHLLKYWSNYTTVHVQHELHLFGSLFVGYLILFLPIIFFKKTWVITSHHAIDYNDIDANFIKNHGQFLPVFVVKFAFKVLYFLYWLRDSIIVHEYVHKERLYSQYGLRKDLIQVIHHWVENKKRIPTILAKEKLWLESYEKIIFYMGYVTWYKDLSVLIKGYSQWVKYNPDSILIIWAGPEKKSLNNQEYLAYYNSLQDLAKELIPKRNYKWLWFVASEDIPAYYSASDVLVVPYRYTLSASGPMAIAISYWLPFLASDCFEEYFVNFSECIFKLSPDGLEKWLVNFFVDQKKYMKTINKMKIERQYRVSMEKTFSIYK